MSTASSTLKDHSYDSYDRTYTDSHIGAHTSQQAKQPHPKAPAHPTLTRSFSHHYNMTLPSSASNPTTITEGRMSRSVRGAGKACETWYRVYGDLGSGRRPLVVLHGGPGVTSDYLAILSDLTQQRSIPVIIYDQLGNGLSTHLPEKMGDVSFWTEQLFLDELKLLLEHLGIYEDYDLLGHSWGGQLGARHAVRQAGGLKRLILMSPLASTELWNKAQVIHRKMLPQDVQDALDKGEREGNTDSKEYQDAVNAFYARFLCTLDPMPEPLVKTFEWLDRDPTVYFTMNGPNEFTVTGSNKNWTIIDEIHKISVPTLLTNGWSDEAADICVYPFFQLIPRVRWVQFPKSSHMAHFEEREKFMDIVGQFLTE